MFQGRPNYLLEGSGHDLGAVVDGKNNVGDTSSGESGDLVLNHGLVGKLDQRFGEGEGLVAESVWAVAVMLNGAERRTRGRRRVPKPPTRMRAAIHRQ